VLEEGAVLFRFLVTGACALLLTGAGFTVAGAAEKTLPAAVTVATAAADAAPTADISPARAAALEAVAPTAGADLAMWGVNPAAEPAPTGAESSLTGSRLVRRFADGILHRSAALAITLTRNAMRFLGVPYVFGGTGSSGFDCSGYVQHVFAMLGYHLPRTADAQFAVGKRVSGAAMAPGDLVFFQTYASGASHVGIYIGNDKFVHASSSHGVTVSSLHESYWSARYLGAKRLI
jgi:cell wall-associated NlpC family hydrolase